MAAVLKHGYWHDLFWGMFKGEKGGRFQQIAGNELVRKSRPQTWMSEKELELVKEYQNVPELFNRPLRSSRIKQVPARIQRLQQLLLSAPRIKKPLLLFRGLSLYGDDPDEFETVGERNLVKLQNKLSIEKLVDQFEIGQAYEPAGFQSFSQDIKVAREFGDDIIIIGLLPSHSRAYQVQMGYGQGWHAVDEHEILLPHGTVWLFLGELLNSTFEILRPDSMRTTVIKGRIIDDEETRLKPVKVGGRRYLVFALLEPAIKDFILPTSRLNRLVQRQSLPMKSKKKHIKASF